MTTQNITPPPSPLEHRVTQLEAELAQIKQLLQQQSPSHPWWQSVFGAFANCPAFDEMERFGQEWRSQQIDSSNLSQPE